MFVCMFAAELWWVGKKDQAGWVYGTGLGDEVDLYCTRCNSWEQHKAN